MVATVDNLLDVGLYSPGDAALFARVPTQLVSRWLWGSKAGEAVLRPQLAGHAENTSEKVLTFLDFVQALAIRAIRLEHKVPLGKIREAVEKAGADYGLQYPFARKHKTFLFGSDVIIKLRDEEYVQVSGKHAHNRMITEVVELYMRDLSFDADGLANEYAAFAWKNYQITMNPHRRFGEPLLSSCGYTARALWEAFRAEGSIEAAATAYGVQPDEVELSCRYYDHLQGNPAA